MIKELQIRPFARPLLVWIAGIMLQTVFSCCTYSWVLLLLPVIILTTAGLVLRGQEHFCYETRWLWGVVFLSLLLFLSIQKTAYSQFEALSEHPASLLSRWAREEQQRLLEPIAKLNLTDEEKSVLATITVGYRQAMSREVRNRFSATGVAHILAVSGFHVAIVCGFLSFLFSFLPRNGCCRWIRYISLLVLLWGFAAITGLAVSSVRAALMLTMYLTGGVLDRRAERYNILKVCRNTRCAFFFFVDYKNRLIFLSCDILRISSIYVFPASKYSYCKLIKQSSQPIHTFFSHFCTYLFYIEGNGKEGKVHEDLILSKMAETFVIHIVFHLSEHGFRFYASLSSVFQPFLGAEQLFGFLPVFSEPVIQFYRPVSFCFKTTAS